ncbi:hypothetical protein V9T40_003420 [Parthenolecanium corni]|uniref:Uncharacterized protein n=1 Tax=Parthenolecanium corni TaxID=536013 RepID=A0AAN9TV14_9HEMI
MANVPRKSAFTDDSVRMNSILTKTLEDDHVVDKRKSENGKPALRRTVITDVQIPGPSGVNLRQKNNSDSEQNKEQNMEQNILQQNRGQNVDRNILQQNTERNIDDGKYFLKLRRYIPFSLDPQHPVAAEYRVFHSQRTTSQSRIEGRVVETTTHPTEPQNMSGGCSTLIELCLGIQRSVLPN